MRSLLLLPKLQIHNANALSSPYTIGFPAMTAWLGAVHALQRRLNQAGHPELRFNSAGVVCHEDYPAHAPRSGRLCAVYYWYRQSAG